MSVTSPNNSQIMRLRSNRQIQRPQFRRKTVAEQAHEVAEVESNSLTNKLQQHKEQEIEQKCDIQGNTVQMLQMQGVSPTQVTPRPHNRRLTRSNKNIQDDIPQLQNEHTPDHKSSEKKEQSITIKKTTIIGSQEQLGCRSSYDLNATIKRTNKKNYDNFTNTYNEGRRSYRKSQKRQIVSIPYRRGHDNFESKIIGLLNKIQCGKAQNKDFQLILQKMHKISSKQLFNKFIISGIRTIVKLSRQQQIYDSQLIDKIEEEQKQINLKIIQDLNKIDQYEEVNYTKIEINMNMQQYKMPIYRKLFKINRKKYPLKSLQQIRQMSIQTGNKMLIANFTFEKAVNFIKQQLVFSSE